jgi:hypothetical protein
LDAIETFAKPSATTRRIGAPIMRSVARSQA